MAERYSETRLNWTGDVWKLLFILKAYRPDLKVRVFDCPPTGLVACTQLNSESTVLTAAYHNILDEFGSAILDEDRVHELWQLFPTVDTQLLQLRPYDLTTLI
jgi:hypothetical protein